MPKHTEIKAHSKSRQKAPSIFLSAVNSYFEVVAAVRIGLRYVLYVIFKGIKTLDETRLSEVSFLVTDISTKLCTDDTPVGFSLQENTRIQ
jgi:hypothetical protein